MSDDAKSAAGPWRVVADDPPPDNNVDVLVQLNEGRGMVLIASQCGPNRWFYQYGAPLSAAPTHWAEINYLSLPGSMVVSTVAWSEANVPANLRIVQVPKSWQST